MIRAPRLSALLGSLFLLLSSALAIAADPPKAPTTKPAPKSEPPAPPSTPTAAAPSTPSVPPAATPSAPSVTPVAPPPAPPPPDAVPPPETPKAPPKKAPPAKAGVKPVVPVAAAAETKKPDDAKKAEAAHRFDRGLELFDQGDNSGALAEFKRTYEILPNPVVLYNIGLVYAAMQRPVDAVDALEPAINAGLPSKQLERAKSMLADQQARIGRLSVTTVPEGAQVEVDNVQVATTPLKAPIRISEGSHIIGAVAEGYAPARKEVVVAGNSDATVKLELVATQGKALANLTVRGTPGSEVRVDNEVSGKTPLETSITLVAGHHVVELRRPGYTTLKRDVDVGEGATGEIEINLAVDPSALGREGANLVLDTSEPGADVTIDGEHKGVYGEPMRLPRGPHHLTVAAAGFLPAEREVDLDPGQANVIRIDFVPTPEKRAAHKSTANVHRTWGLVGVIAGPAIALGAGLPLVLVGSNMKSDGVKETNAVAEKDKAGVEPPCDRKNGYEAEGGDDGAACNQAYVDAQNKYDDGKSLELGGFIAIGVGAAVTVTGLVLLLTGDDPDKYDHPPSHKLSQPRKPAFALVPGPGQFGTGFRLSF
jgi:hypothetical protein